MPFSKRLHIRLYMCLLSLVSLLAPSFCSADDYLWPLSASQELTSGFCQWRSGHFHSGIDIRTYGKTGYKVSAVADGYVYRIVTRWRGYGKALYLKLDDGNIAVYGHLLKFTPEIDTYVQEHQLATRRYMTDIYPLKGKFRFKKGDIVAYTGMSGTGAPHLHFEIRTPDQKPISPLTFYPSLLDDRPPVIRGLSFRPLSPVRSRISGKGSLTEIPLLRSAGRYVSKDTSVVYGPVGIELECVDKRPGTDRNFAVSRIEAYIDSETEPFFATTYDTISFDTWNEVDFELNYSRAIRGDRFVHNLYLFPGNMPPVVNDMSRNRGWIEVSDSVDGVDLSPGVHELILRVYDQSGNISWAKASIELRFSPAFPGYFTSDRYEGAGDLSGWEYEVALYDPDGGAFVESISGDSASMFIEYLNGDIALLGHFKDFTGDMILVTAVGEDGSRFEHLLRMSDTGMPVFPPFSYVPSHCLTMLAVQSRYSPVELDIGCLIDMWNDQTAHAGSICLSLPVLLDPVQPSILIDITNVTIRDTLEVTYGRPFAVGGTGSSDVMVRFPDGHFIVSGNDLHSPSAMVLDTTTTNVKGYGVARTLSVLPEDLLLSDEIEMVLRIPESFDSNKSALFKVEDESTPVYVRGTVLGDSVVEVTLSKMGSYAPLQDTVAPKIWDVKPAEGGTVRRSRPKITFMMEDELSGIEDDRDVEIAVDGVWAIPEYDIERRLMVTYSSQNLKPGKHTLTIRVRDRMGNEASHSSTFTRVR